MHFDAREIKTKDGRTVILRKADVQDGTALIEYLKVTAKETRFLISEPDEMNITPEQEEAFIKTTNESENELMLIATLDGRHVGNCAMRSIGTRQRYKHRCSVSIALYKEFWGNGIGRQMLAAILEQAKLAGYEQAELEVVADNARALKMYESLGFVVCGKLPRNMKYKDGTYADAYFMAKEL